MYAFDLCSYLVKFVITKRSLCPIWVFSWVCTFLIPTVICGQTLKTVSLSLQFQQLHWLLTSWMADLVTLLPCYLLFSPICDFSTPYVSLYDILCGDLKHGVTPRVLWAPIAVSLVTAITI